MNRRTFVAGSTMALTAGLAGCSALVGSGREEFAYLDWIGDSVIEDDTDRIDITSVDISSFEKIFPDEREGFARYLGQEPEDMDYTVRITSMIDRSLVGCSVFVGDVDTDTAIDVLENNWDDSFAPEDEYKGYDVYVSDNFEFVLGSTNDTLISSSEREWFEKAVDANAGDEPLLSEQDDRLETIDSHLAHQDMVVIEISEEGGEDAMVAMGGSFQLGEDESDVEAVFIFSNKEAADQVAGNLEDAEGELEFEGIRFETDGLSDISVDGRILSVEATIPTDEI